MRGFTQPLLAIVTDLWRRYFRYYYVIVGAAVPLIATQTGGVLYRVGKNRSDRNYQPVVRNIRSHATAADVVNAGSEFGFGLGFHRPLIDDCRLGYYNGFRPAVIVLSDYTRYCWIIMKDEPEAWKHIHRTIADE